METILFIDTSSNKEIVVGLRSNGKKFEKELNRKINVFFEENFDKLSKELKQNVINGYKLNGFLRVQF